MKSLRITFVVLTLVAIARAASPVDLLVKNAQLIPCDPAQPSSFYGYMTVDADGRILAMEAGEPPAELTASAVRMLDAAGKIVAPGFISAHSHLYMSPLRGLGHDQTLYGWFRAWDNYLSHSNAEDLYWFTLHGSLDFLRNGVTTAYDFTYGGTEEWKPSIGAGEAAPQMRLKPGPFQENQIRAKADAGLRFYNSVSLTPVGTKEEIKQRFLNLLSYTKREFGTNPLYLGTAISGGVQFQPEKSTAFLEAEVARENDLINQSHFLESPDRVAEQQVKFDWYVEAGALNPKFIFGHFIHTNDYIIETTAKAGAAMSWQPTSNGRLADGYADILRYQKAGIRIAVGLDDQSCTDVPDPFQNMRIGLYTTRAFHKDATALSIYEMLRLHTLGSAEVLGIADKVGSLTPGKFADFLLVDPRSPDSGPVYEPLATYVLACDLRNVKQVYVGGKLKVEGLKLIGVDEIRLRTEIDTRTNRLRAAAAGVDATASKTTTALPVTCSDCLDSSLTALASIHP
jgi:5-methylthioadenosine/S-adenosylhomocysteine deaminase